MLWGVILQGPWQLPLHAKLVARWRNACCFRRQRVWIATFVIVCVLSHLYFCFYLWSSHFFDFDVWRTFDLLQVEIWTGWASLWVSCWVIMFELRLTSLFERRNLRLLWQRVCSNCKIIFTSHLAIEGLFGWIRLKDYKVAANSSWWLFAFANPWGGLVLLTLASARVIWAVVHWAATTLLFVNHLRLYHTLNLRCHLLHGLFYLLWQLFFRNLSRHLIPWLSFLQKPDCCVKLFLVTKVVLNQFFLANKLLFLHNVVNHGVEFPSSQTVAERLSNDVLNEDLVFILEIVADCIRQSCVFRDCCLIFIEPSLNVANLPVVLLHTIGFCFVYARC